jgi:type I restriction enzyme M protein
MTTETPIPPESRNGHAVDIERWLWAAASSIRGAQEAPKYKDFILPLVFAKRLCDVFDDEVDRIASEVGSRSRAYDLIARDKKLVRFYLPIRPKNADNPTWSEIRKLTGRIGERLTSILREIGKENPSLQGIIDRVDFNATTHGQRDLDDDRLSNLIERISERRLGLDDVEPDIIGRSYEYLIRKFAENSGQSAGEFYTPKEVGFVIARLVEPSAGLSIYDPCSGSGGLLIKCQLVAEANAEGDVATQLALYGQELIGSTWAMANMNMIIHDMEGQIEIGDTFRTPRFLSSGGLRRFDRVVANPMWSQTGFSRSDYDDDTYGRFPGGAGYPGNRADWGWMQHVLASLAPSGRAAVVLGTGAASRGSGDAGRRNLERTVRKWFVHQDLIEAVVLLPENLFYNTQNAGLLFVVARQKAQKDSIIMVDASEFYERGRSKNVLSAEGAATILTVISDGEAIPGVSAVASTVEIASERNDYNLLPNRYIHRPLRLGWESVVANRFDGSQRAFTKYLNFHFLAQYFARLKTEVGGVSEADVASLPDWRLVPLADVVDPSDLTYESREPGEEPAVLSLTKDDGLVEQSERFGHAVALEDLSGYKLVREGWLVYNPMVIWEGAVHVLYAPACGVVSPAYEVWQGREVDPRYLDFILKTPAVLDEYRRLSAGGVKRRRIVSTRDFLSINVPVPKGNVAAALTRALDSLEKRLHTDLAGLVTETLQQLG